MIYRAYDSFTKTLLSMPETGMGYQIIDAIIPGHRLKKRYYVFNSELIFDSDSDFTVLRKDIRIMGYKQMLYDAKFLSLESPVIVKRSEVKNLRTLSDSNMSEKGRHSGGTAAIDSPLQSVNGENITYVRLSAYENDKRIDTVNKKLKPGSYTTTEDDYLTCKKYSDDPIDRYALPNDEPIKWAFYILPIDIDQRRRGIVQPANNHEGGGIEAYFDYGTSNNTYKEKKPY